MAYQEWTSARQTEATAAIPAPTSFPAPLGIAAPGSALPPGAAAYQMRPLSTGEVLDRTFSVYRSRFWLFAGMSAMSGAVQLVANAFNLVVHHVVLVHYGFAVATIVTQVGAGIAGLLFLLAAAVTQGATVYALSEVYLGRDATVTGSLRATLPRWYRYLGIALWQGWSAVWVMLLLIIPAFILILALKLQTLYVVAGLLIFVAVFGGGTYGAIAYLRNSLAVPAAVIEGLKVRAAMRRSKDLAVGTKGRIFVVLLIAWALYMVAGVIQAPMLFFIARAPLQEHVIAQSVILAVGFIAHTLVTPVALVGLSLVYFDQRVRREGFDLLMLLGPDLVVPVTHVAAVPFAELPVAAPSFAAPSFAASSFAASSFADPSSAVPPEPSTPLPAEEPASLQPVESIADISPPLTEVPEPEPIETARPDDANP